MLQLNRLKSLAATAAGAQRQLFGHGSSPFRNLATLRMIQPVQYNSNTLLVPIKPKFDIIKTEYSTPPPPSSSATNLWIAERAVSIALIGLVPIAIAMPCKPLDIILAVSLVAHTYWGFEAVISEYVRTILFGSVIPKVAHVLLIAIMVATLGGLFYLIFDDIGLAGTIRRLWTIKSKRE